MNRLVGRNAVVTGASRGIGAAIAERLAAEGANVVAVARTVSRHDHLAGSLNETVRRCRAYGTQVEALPADLSNPSDSAAVIPRALDRLGGRIDILVNNAAAAIYASMLDYPSRRARLLFEVNFHAPMLLTQAVLPTMLDAGEGWIVNVSSATARPAAGPPFRTGGVAAQIGVYGSAKAALNRITNAFAVELYGRGVRVNTIEPRAAVMSEGAEAILGPGFPASQVEPMEAMVEATVELCACEPELTGRSFVSLDLIAERRLTVHGLDGRVAKH